MPHRLELTVSVGGGGLVVAAAIPPHVVARRLLLLLLFEVSAGPVPPAGVRGTAPKVGWKNAGPGANNAKEATTTAREKRQPRQQQRPQGLAAHLPP